MLIIADYRINDEILNSLKKMGEVVLLQTKGVVYDSICGHPDIFMCKTPKGLVVAPEMPTIIIQKLIEYQIPFEEGKSYLGSHYPQTVHYNAVVTNKHIIHQTDFTDCKILDMQLDKIKIPQGYAQCNMIALNESSFVVSDKGIENKLKKENLEVYYYNPSNISLFGQNFGFIGGCCGLHENIVYITGSVNHSEGQNLKDFIQSKGHKLVSLTDKPLMDYGGIFFLEKDEFK